MHACTHLWNLASHTRRKRSSALYSGSTLNLDLTQNLMLTLNQNLTLSLILSQLDKAWNQEDVHLQHLQESEPKGKQECLEQGVSLTEE